VQCRVYGPDPKGTGLDALFTRFVRLKAPEPT
jgi:hypothetical protein